MTIRPLTSMSVKPVMALLVMLVAGSVALGRKKHDANPFKFVGGTEQIPQSCAGLVELEPAALTFKCPAGSVSVPYSSITLMQYRPDVSHKIRNMKINWKVKPGGGFPFMRGKKNRYFTVVYKERDDTLALVLAVAPETMRPYLAEIDVKSGQSVEVMETEEYD